MSQIVESRSESALTASAAGSEDTASSSSAIEPPDSLQAVSAGLRGLAISSSSRPPCQSTLGSSYPPPTPSSKSSDRLAHTAHIPQPASASYSTSPASRYGRHFPMTNSSSTDSQLNYDAYLAVPASPSMSEGLTDSPGSVSSMSSFRRGDLADIEDLDLEPELETVSECDEESSSLCSLDIGIDLDSDSERASSHGGDNDHLSTSAYSLGLSASHSSRQAHQRPASHGTAASDYARRKRSEWLLNNYANKIAARRPRRIKKGRITEIVEEGGECINTTVMPKAPFACGASEWSCEVSGPPLAPPRSVSPSDTVPAVPSPLCSCVSAENGNPTAPAGLEESVKTIKAYEAVASARAHRTILDQSQISSQAESSTSKAHAERMDDVKEELDLSPPRLSRSSSRRNSSPVKLRPCFRQQSSQASTRESSCERDPPRGRSVRFSSRPPQELRTHSPVEYDRKSCPVNNRLSPADVEELRTMKMEMGLLEARWTAVAACKPKKVEGTEGTTKPENYNAYNAGIAAINASRACGAESDSTTGPGSAGSPTARLRQQKERERLQERQRNLPHYMRNRPCVASSEALSIRNKFGQAPPPPLPGTPASTRAAAATAAAAARASSMSPSRSTSAPPTSRSAQDARSPRRMSFQNMPTGPSEIPVLTQTSPSPPSSPRSSLNKQLNSSRETWSGSVGPHLSAERGRPGPCAAAPLPSPWSSGSSSATSSIYSSTYFPSGPSTPSCVSYPGGNGYDSPASEFYESGSEYDMIC